MALLPGWLSHCHAITFMSALELSCQLHCRPNVCVHKYRNQDLYSMGAIRWGTRGMRPPTFSDSGDIIYYLPHIFLGLVICWFHTKLSPSHFATKLRSCYIYSFYYMLSHSIVWHLLHFVYNILNMQRFMPHQ